MANLKTKETRKLSTPNFPKNEHFLPPDTHVFFCKKTNGAINYFVKKLVCVSGSKKCTLFEKSCVLCFFVNLRFEISPFALSPISWSSFATLSFLILQWNHLNTKSLHTLILRSSCLLKGIFSKFHFLYLANLNEWTSISPVIFRKPTGFLLFYYFRGNK